MANVFFLFCPFGYVLSFIKALCSVICFATSIGLFKAWLFKGIVYCSWFDLHVTDMIGKDLSYAFYRIASLQMTSIEISCTAFTGFHRRFNNTRYFSKEKRKKENGIQDLDVVEHSANCKGCLAILSWRCREMPCMVLSFVRHSKTTPGNERQMATPWLRPDNNRANLNLGQAPLRWLI